MKKLESKIWIKSIFSAQSYVDRIKDLISHQCSQGKIIRVLDVGGAGGKIWSDFKCGCIHLTIIDPWFPEQDFQDPADARFTAPFQEVARVLEDETYDLVVAIDLVEHLSVPDGFLLMYEMVRLSKRYAFVYTPNGFLWQPPSPNNPLNAHISGWSIENLRAFGFSNFKGHVGAKLFWGPYALPRFSYSNKLLVAANLVGNLLVKISPSHALAISGLAKVDKFQKALKQII